MPHDSILQNIIPHLASLWESLKTGFLAVGLGLTVWSLGRAAVKGQSPDRRISWAALVIGVLFLNTPSLLDALSRTVLGQSSVQTLSYRPPAQPADVYIRFSVFLVAVVGLIGLGRGLWLLKDSAGDRGALSRGLIHIAGGILCINLVATIRLMAQALGGGLPDVVRSIFG
jgi:hypothetical protein